MMLLLFILFDPFVSALVIGVPVFLYARGPSSAHPWFLAAALVLLFGLGGPLVWRARRRYRRACAAAPPENARWPAGFDAARYRARVGVFLRTAGWRVAFGEAALAGAVMVLAMKDRTAVALLFLPPDCRADAAALAILDGRGGVPPAATAIVVVQGRPTDAERAGAACRGFGVVGIADLARTLAAVEEHAA